MTKITFIGGGNMAFALVRGLLAQANPPAITVADPISAQLGRFGADVVVSTDNTTAVVDADAVILAVKPQVAREVVSALADSLQPGQLLISIAAGISITSLSNWLRRDEAHPQPIVRCMPNTPALLGAGITGMAANGAVDQGQRQLAEDLLRAAGDVVVLNHETDLDAVTAVSGSGPAYFFYLLEAMISAGEEMALSRDDATRLAVATALGAARMALESGDDPTTLRERVTSPGGTTEAAIKALDDSDVGAKVRAAIHAARLRSQALGQEFD